MRPGGHRMLAQRTKLQLHAEKVRRMAIGFSRIGDWKPLQHPGSLHACPPF